MNTELPQIPGIDTKRQLEMYYITITKCLVEYGGLTEKEAKQLIDKSGLFSDLNTIHDLTYLFHEEPYYWAMDLLHAPHNKEWYHDKRLWPPPQNYYDDFDLQ